MMRRFAPAVALALVAGAALADENSDLNLIPEAAQPAPAASAPAPVPGTASTAASSTGRFYLETATSVASLRSALPVPFPPPAPGDWEERVFLDAREQWSLTPNLELDYSGRLNLRATDRLSVPTHENVRHDFREGYMSWEPIDGTFVDAGRINEKNGVAVGYNPTDFFKTHAVVEPLSLDPAVLREDRLGTAMVRASHVGDTGSVTLAFAPQFEKPSPIFTPDNLPSFDPTFGRTNARDRLLLAGSPNLHLDLSPEFLLYREGAATREGVNLTEPVGRKIVAYAEWAGGNAPDVTSEALAYGHATGVIPESAPAPLPNAPNGSYRSALSLGASYATEYDVTFNAEYHYNGAGFTHQDWRNWFAAGTAHADIPGVTQQLWYIRDYAADVEEPLAQQSLFLRFDWVDAFVPKLELTGFTNTDLYDGSTLVQLTADYDLSNRWTVGAIASADLGSRRTEFGSLPQAETLLFKVARDF